MRKRFVASLLAVLASFSMSVAQEDIEDINNDKDPRESLHVYIAIGQSNMYGVAAIQDEDKQTHERIKMMSTANSRGNVGEWLPAVPPMCIPAAGYSLSDKFIRVMADSVPDCVTIGIIPVALGGVSFKAFDPDICESYISSLASDKFQSIAKEYDFNPYKRIVECAKIAQETGVIKGIILHQGESDNGFISWLTMVQKFYDNICNDLNLDPAKTPILVGEMLENGSCIAHNAIIAQLPDKISNCAVISSSGLEGENDSLHFTHDSYTELGIRYAEKMLTMIDFDGKCPKEDSINIKVSSPYNGVAAKIPGTIEAENFDEGGCFTAWYDKSIGNYCDEYSNEYRSDYVDIKKDSVAYIVSNCQSGEWMKYTVDVQEDGEYYLTVRASGADSISTFTLTLDDDSINYTVNVEKADSLNSYLEQIQSNSFNLSKGTHVLKLTIDTDGIDIDWLKFSTDDSEIETIVKKEFAIVPNPASTAIYIYSEGEIENVSIYNALGEAVARTNESRVDVSTLPAGVYFVKATIDGESVVKRLVVTK